jgi:hypothetical protein
MVAGAVAPGYGSVNKECVARKSNSRALELLVFNGDRCTEANSRTLLIPTKDGGTLRTIQEGCQYMAAISKEREQRRHWQQVRELIDQEADVDAVSWKLRIAVLKTPSLTLRRPRRGAMHQSPFWRTQSRPPSRF